METITAPSASLTKPVITLKKLQVCESLSEETLAYTAIVVVDGVPAIDASNRGHGGADLYRSIYDSKTETHDHRAFEVAMGKLKAWAEAALLGDVTTEFPVTVESLILDAITEVRDAKHRVKALKRLTQKVYLHDSSGLRAITPRSTADFEATIGHAMAKYPGSVVVNTLSADAAWAILKNYSV